MWGPSHRLYACEFVGGVIKVGTTRQQGLQRFNSTRLNGQQPVRIYCGQLHGNGFGSERELVSRIQDAGGEQISGREWFSGISFHGACLLIDQISAHFAAEPVIDGAPA